MDTEKKDAFLKALPDIFGRHEKYPDDMIGATIISIGTIPDGNIDGGGLIIDYRPSGSNATKRVVFAFCETGMWVESRIDAP